MCACVQQHACIQYVVMCTSMCVCVCVMLICSSSLISDDSVAKQQICVSPDTTVDLQTGGPGRCCVHRSPGRVVAPGTPLQAHPWLNNSQVDGWSWPVTPPAVASSSVSKIAQTCHHQVHFRQSTVSPFFFQPALFNVSLVFVPRC